MLDEVLLDAPLLASSTRLCAATDAVDFSAKIAPLFEEHCVDCHAADDPDGELSLESFASLIKGGKAGKVITPGNAQDSLLVKFLEGRSGKEGKNRFMPPTKPVPWTDTRDSPSRCRRSPRATRKP